MPDPRDPMTPDLDAIRELAAFVRGGYDEEVAACPDRWYVNVSADAVKRLLDGTDALMAWGEHLAAEVERLRAENAELRGRVSLAADDLESINVAYEVGYANGRRDTQGGNK